VDRVTAENLTDEQIDKACVQCASNARWNRAGGYLRLAAECLAYCEFYHAAINARRAKESSDV